MLRPPPPHGPGCRPGLLSLALLALPVPAWPQPAQRHHGLVTFTVLMAPEMQKGHLTVSVCDTPPPGGLAPLPYHRHFVVLTCSPSGVPKNEFFPLPF